MQWSLSNYLYMNEYMVTGRKQMMVMVMVIIVKIKSNLGFYLSDHQ